MRKKKKEAGVVREWKKMRNGEIESRRKRCPKMEKNAQTKKEVRKTRENTNKKTKDKNKTGLARAKTYFA